MAQAVRERIVPILSRAATPLWLGLITIFAFWLLIRHTSDLKLAADVVAHSNLKWALAAVLAQLVIVGLITGKFRILLARLGADLEPHTMARIHLRRNVIGLVVPFGGPAALLQFARDLGKHGVGGGTAMRVSLLATIVNEVAFALFLIPTLVWLGISGRLTGATLAGSAALAVIFASAIITAITLLRRKCLPSAITSRMPGRFNAFVVEMQSHGFQLADVTRALPYAFGVNIAGLAMLAASLQAVGQHPSVTTILAARVAASVTMLILPVFQGAGAVEIVVVGALHTGGVPMADAIAAMVVFRIGQFWAPIALGGLAMLPWEQVDQIALRVTPTFRLRALSIFVAIASISLAWFVDLDL